MIESCELLGLSLNRGRIGTRTHVSLARYTGELKLKAPPQSKLASTFGEDFKKITSGGQIQDNLQKK